MSNVSLVDGHIEEPKKTDEEIVGHLNKLVYLYKKDTSATIGGLPLISFLGDILDLINRLKAEIDIILRKKEKLRDLVAEQQAEIERLNKEVDRLSQCVMYHDGHISDAIKEFAERFEKEIETSPYMSVPLKYTMLKNARQIKDNLVKEMVGD